MIESIEERKRKIAEYYENEYAPKPKIGWWSKEKSRYESTREIYERKGGPQHYETETIIRNDKKGAAISAALFLLASVPVWINEEARWRADGLLCNLFIYTVICMSVISCFDRRPKIILNKYGIYTLKWNGYIHWKNIAAIYIKEDDSGDTSGFYLVVHYYYTETDKFLATEYGLGGLEKPPDDIACFIHRFWSEFNESQYNTARPVPGSEKIIQPKGINNG